MTNKLNLSLSQLFNGSWKPTDEVEVKLCSDQDDNLDERLAARLSTVPGKSRSPRKKSSKTKKIVGPIDGTSKSYYPMEGSESSCASKSVHESIETSGRSTGTRSTSPNDSYSSIAQFHMEVAEGTNRVAAEALHDMPQKQGEERRGKPPLRLEEKLWRTTGTPKSKKSSVASRISTASARSRTRRSAIVDSNGGPALPFPQRTAAKGTKPNNSANNDYRSNRRAALREHQADSLRSKMTKECHPRRNSGNDSQRKMYPVIPETVSILSAESIHLIAQPISSPSSPVALSEGKWTCECGSVMRNRMNFCGMCGSQKEKQWTCHDCQFQENLCEFSFCGHCGVSREGCNYRD